MYRVVLMPCRSLVLAPIETYFNLLEKVRLLISEAPGERKCPVFHKLLAGVSQREQEVLWTANVTARDFKCHFTPTSTIGKLDSGGI